MAFSWVEAAAAPPPPDVFCPSPQQAAVFDWVASGTGHAIIVAVAGAGKTTTLIEACVRMRGSICLAAYNKRIADEIKKRVSARLVGRVDVGTFHSFGLRAWRRVYPDVEVNGRKVGGIIKELQAPRRLWRFVNQLVSLSKQAGVGIESSSGCPRVEEMTQIVDHYGLDEHLTGGQRRLEDTIEYAIEYAMDVLLLSIDSAADVVDFEDMLYMPLLQGLRFDQYDWVLIDEAQDSNMVRRKLAARMQRSGGRLVAVGDPAQAIYGFTGADSDALDIIRDTFNAIELPLTISYRCPKRVVMEAQKYVSHIEAHESTPDGLVERMANSDFSEWRKTNQIVPSAILCRNTAPLVELAYTLLRENTPCHVEGRNIGERLMNLIARFPATRVAEALFDKLEQYFEKMAARWRKREQDSKIEDLRDRIDTLRAINDGVDGPARDVVELRSRIERLFVDTVPGEDAPVDVTLSTIHKAKGREWDRVFWYGSNLYQPSKYAKREWEKRQEQNLMYVAATRAKAELFIVDA